MSDTKHLVHWAGTAVRSGSVIRQRCMWCGAMIAEIDIERVAYEDPDGNAPNPFIHEDGTPKSQWEPGALVAIDGDPDGGASAFWLVEEPADGKAPEESCMRLDTAVTT